MSFMQTVRRARELLREEGRVTLQGLQREFGLDAESVELLVQELVDGQQVAAGASSRRTGRGRPAAPGHGAGSELDHAAPAAMCRRVGRRSGP